MHKTFIWDTEIILEPVEQQVRVNLLSNNYQSLSKTVTKTDIIGFDLMPPINHCDAHLVVCLVIQRRIGRNDFNTLSSNISIKCWNAHDKIKNGKG